MAAPDKQPPRLIRCRNSYPGAAGSEEPLKEPRSFYEFYFVLHWQHVLEEVVHMPGCEPQNVLPNVPTHEKGQEEQGERQLITFHLEAPDRHSRFRLAARPVVNDGEDHRWTRQGIPSRPVQEKGEERHQNGYHEQEKDILARSLSEPTRKLTKRRTRIHVPLMILQLRAEIREKVQLHHEAEREASEEHRRG